MAAVAGYPWSPNQSPTGQSQDMTSSVYPERVIRPLPKRPIKSRLSTEQANAIVYPPAPLSSSPLFGSPYSQGGHGGTNPAYSHSDADPRSPNDHSHLCGCGEDHSEVDSEADGGDYGSVAHRYFEPSSMQRFPRGSKPKKVPPPNSSTSSADGYESFENTNNKKKRKIPVSGTGGYLSSFSSDQPSLTSTQSNEAGPSDLRSSTLGQHTARNISPSYADRSDIAISSTGRGRYSRPSNRSASHRPPLGPSPSSINNYQSGVAHKFKAAGASSGKGFRSMQSNRNASDSNATENIGDAAKGKENFTFNAPSESSKKMGLVPETGLHLGSSMSQLHASVPYSTKAASTSGAQNISNPSHSNNIQPATNQPGPRSSQTLPKSQPPPETEETIRRNHRRELRLQVRQRRLQAEYNAYHNPPGPDDVWICEFCEYKAVFGERPKHIIRQFEETQLKKQKQADVHKRLLEKAKKSSKKNRKAKGHVKHSALATQQHQLQSQANDLQYDELVDPDLEGQSDDLFEPSYGDLASRQKDSKAIDPELSRIEAETGGGGSSRGG